ncbi:hypothetical protein BGX34_010621 [Mortierella sp. NVP85]|nr:hypothetical protein BGX34_010621 [Mortierella sp. NVP85]
MNPSSPTSSTSSKKKQPPKPTNSFMIYHTEKLHELRRNTAAKLSEILGARWKAEPLEVKERYAELVKEAERRHAEQYPKRGTGKEAQAVRAKAGIKSPHSIGHVVPSHPPSFALYPSSSTAKSFTPYPYTNTDGGQVNISTPYLPRRSDSIPGPMRHFDPLQSFPWTTPFLSDPTQSQQPVEATLGSSVKSEDQNQSQNQGQGLNETTYFNQLLNAELAEAVKMNPPRPFYVRSTETDSMTGLVAALSSMGLPTTPGEDPLAQVLLDTGVSSLAITSPSPLTTSSLSSSSSDVETTAATTDPILGGSPALANGLSFPTTQASTMVSAPIQIPMFSPSISMSTRHVPTESPDLGSFLIG